MTYSVGIDGWRILSTTMTDQKAYTLSAEDRCKGKFLCDAGVL